MFARESMVRNWTGGLGNRMRHDECSRSVRQYPNVYSMDSAGACGKEMCF